jgi:hypothetical protein
MTQQRANCKRLPVLGPSGTGVSGAVLTGQDAAAHIRRRLASRDWWLLVTCERRGTDFLAHLERTFYAGPANKDFEVVLLPALHEGFGLVGLFLARKCRLPVDRLQREMTARIGPITVKELRVKDVLVLHPDVKVARALAEFVVTFLRRRSSPEDRS